MIWMPLGMAVGFGVALGMFYYLLSKAGMLEGFMYFYGWKGEKK